MRSRRNLPHNQFLQDPLAYAHSIGKYGSGNVYDALRDEGLDTTLRIALAPTDSVPMRAMGYVAAAQYMRAAYFPYAQLQVVVPYHTVNRVNGIPANRLRATGRQLFDSLFFYPRPLDTSPDKLLYAKDVADPPYINLSRLAYLMRGVKGEDRLKRQAAHRKASHVEYVAGHIHLHDVVDSITPFYDNDPTPVSTARRIISIGTDSKERAFYEARAATARKGGLYDALDLADEVGQIFTLHVPTPYDKVHAASFDPHCLDFDQLRSEIMADPFAQRFNPVVRDLGHLASYVDAMFAAQQNFTQSLAA